MEKHRNETDFIGDKKIADSAYYGINALRGHENFNISEDKVESTLIKAVAWVKKACALANLDCGGLDKKIADAIVYACDKIADGAYEEQFIVNPMQGGGGTSFNMNANEVIANIALEFLGHEKGSYNIIKPLAHVNMAQSTNDIFPTAINLALILKSIELLGILNAAEASLLEKSREFGAKIKMGRTHLNAAASISFGQCFDAHAQMLNRDSKRISAATDPLYSVPLGGTAVGTGLDTTLAYRESVIDRLREVTGIYIKADSNLADGIHNVDNYAALSSALKICMLNLSKMASDLRILGSDKQHGFGELALPPLQLGSSIIPDKVNPVISELINQVAFIVCGHDLSISMAAQAGQLELNVYKPVISHCLFKSINIMRESISLFDTLYLRELQVT